MWAEKGPRPTAVKQTDYQWAYVSAAVNPLTGEALGMITEEMNTLVMNDLLANLSLKLGPDRHAVLVWDGAGFHTGKRLEVPENITPLPPYSPQLNGVERLWLWMRTHHLSNRAYEDREHIKRAIADSCSRIDPERVKTICRTPWLDRIERKD